VQSRILVIDDEKAICDGCSLVLSEQGHKVDACRTGREGLQALEGDEYDLVLLDMKLPDLDGIEILRSLKGRHSGAYVIVITGYSTVENAVEAMKLGAFDYLSKPFSDDELVLAVDRALENKRLKDENLALRKQLGDQFDFSNIIGKNSKMLKVFDQVRKVAPTDSTVLIYGESGTGKELIARAIHAHSNRAGRQFVPVDCSTFASSLLESELFGHVKGAFTGADHDKPGVFEMAKGGTLFLDEVANLNTDIQAKLLRVMETQEYKPVGATQIRKIDARIIAATNRDLKAMVPQGDFREDLFYRLNVFPIYLPPLRERRDDIPSLIYHFLRLYCRKTGKKISGFSDDALEALVEYDWPGNVRELKNVVERLVIMSDKNVLDSSGISPHLDIYTEPKASAIPSTLAELKAVKKRLLEKEFGEIEKAFLKKALAAANGNITKAARLVGMQRSNFSTLMKKHHLSPEDARGSSHSGNLPSTRKQTERP